MPYAGRRRKEIELLQSGPSRPSSSEDRPSASFPHAVLSLFLLAVAFLLIVVLPGTQLDFPLTDGAYYFETARRLAPDRQWSPLFIVFYASFHKVMPGLPMEIYTAHRLVVLGLTTLLFWLISRRIFSAGKALLLALALLASNVLLHNLFVVHTASLAGMLLLLFYLLVRREDHWTLVGLAACGTLVRPEFLPVLALAAVGVLVRALRGNLPKPRALDLGSAAFCVFLFAIVYAKSGSRPDYDRSFDAFSQRSGWAALRRSGESARSGHIGHLERTREIYGPVNSIPEAILSNPGAFATHLYYNLQELPREVLYTVLPSGMHWSSLLVWGLLAVGLMGNGSTRAPPGLFWVLAGTFAAGAVGVCLLLEPKTVYLIPVLPLAFWGVGRLLSRLALPLRQRRAPFWMSFALAAAVLVVVVWGAPAAPWGGKPVLECAELLEQQAEEAGEIRLYAFSGLSYCTVLASRGKACSAFHTPAPSPTSDLRALLASARLNAGIADDFLRQLYRDSSSDVLDEFEKSPGTFGFRLIHRTRGWQLGDTRLYVLVQD